MQINYAPRHEKKVTEDLNYVDTSNWGRLNVPTMSRVNALRGTRGHWREGPAENA